MKGVEAKPARPEAGPHLMPAKGSTRPPDGCEHKRLHHTPPIWVSDGSMYFITICCEPRGKNQLCRATAADIILAAARKYHEGQRWYLRLLLLMPDHLHMLLAPAPGQKLSQLIGGWKSYLAKTTGISWQRNFFDHRLRSEESWDEKAAYIRANPIRAGLIHSNGVWPFQIQH